MGRPVVHFEINSAAAPGLARFYADAFDWHLESDGPEYTQIRTDGTCEGSGVPGIDGGIGQSEPGDDFVTFYIQVPNVVAALDRVVQLGASVELPATEAGQVVIAMFRDPAGNRIGLVRSQPLAQG